MLPGALLGHGISQMSSRLNKASHRDPLRRSLKYVERRPQATLLAAFNLFT